MADENDSSPPETTTSNSSPKPIVPAPAPPPPARSGEALAAPRAEYMTLVDFCNDQLARNRNHEMIGAFATVERAAGNFIDTPADYEARLAKLGEMPASGS